MDKFQNRNRVRPKKWKIRVATLLAIIGKEALQIYRDLPMTEKDRNNPKEMIYKLEVYFKPKKT